MNRRLAVPAVVLLLSAALFAGQVATAPPPAPDAPEGGEGAYPGNTLVTLQAEGWFGNNNGRALVVNPAGETVWEYDPPNARVFDGEATGQGTFLFSVAVVVPNPECPARYQGGRSNCVLNRVVEIDRETKEEVWVHEWYDAFPTHHEVHDADRLPSGETAIIDMGNDRVFTVDQQGSITWTWNASAHLTEGTPFWEEYVKPLPEGERDEFRRKRPEGDWTHMNDVDLLSNGNLQFSIRNFDSTIEVARPSGEIVDVIGAPTRHEVMNEQHNPNRLERHGNLLIADSENDRVVEVDVETEEVVWEYDGSGTGTKLQWPRDADRLPNGNTLITDSRNFRVIEVGPNGTVVWSYAMPDARGIIYEADRLGPADRPPMAEEPDDVPPGGQLETRVDGGSGLSDMLATADSWLAFVFPYWVGVPELATALLGVVSGLAFVRESHRDGLFERLS